MNLELKTKTYKDSFLVIHLESLRVNSMLEFDLYIDNGTELVLYRNALLPFDDKNRQSLLDNNIKHLYVSSSMKELYQRYIEDNIKDIINDDSIEEAVKASIVYDSANLLVREVLSKPTVRENIERTEQMVENTVSFILIRKLSNLRL